MSLFSSEKTDAEIMIDGWLIAKNTICSKSNTKVKITIRCCISLNHKNTSSYIDAFYILIKHNL